MNANCSVVKKYFKYRRKFIVKNSWDLGRVRVGKDEF